MNKTGILQFIVTLGLILMMAYLMMGSYFAAKENLSYEFKHNECEIKEIETFEIVDEYIHIVGVDGEECWIEAATYTGTIPTLD
jgi:hypothetical protein